MHKLSLPLDEQRRLLILLTLEVGVIVLEYDRLWSEEHRLFRFLISAYNLFYATSSQIASLIFSYSGGGPSHDIYEGHGAIFISSIDMRLLIGLLGRQSSLCLAVTQGEPVVLVRHCMHNVLLLYILEMASTMA